MQKKEKGKEKKSKENDEKAKSTLPPINQHKRSQKNLRESNEFMSSSFNQDDSLTGSLNE